MTGPSVRPILVMTTIAALLAAASPAAADTAPALDAVPPFPAPALVRDAVRDTPRVDYRRAESFLSWNIEPLVTGMASQPNWLGPDDDRFWYRVRIERGHAFWLVDPERNARQPAFDTDRLAAAMSLAADTAFRGDRLPFQTFEYVDAVRVITFTAHGKRYRCDVVAYTCDVRETERGRSNAFVASPDSVWEAFVHEHDLYVRPLGGGDSIRLTTDGEPFRAYGLTAPGANDQLQNRTRRPNVRWSPDSRRIAVVRTDEREVRRYPMYSSVPLPRGVEYPYALPGDSIVPQPAVHIIDIEARTNRQVDIALPHTGLRLGNAPDSLWTPDGRRLRFVIMGRGSKTARLIDVDAATAEPRVLAFDTSATFLEVGHGLNNWYITSDGQDAFWYSERTGWPHLYRFDATAGQPAGPRALEVASPAAGTGAGDPADADVAREPPFRGVLRNAVTTGAWHFDQVQHVDERRRVIYFTARGREAGRNPYHAHLYRVNFDGTGLRILTPEDAHHQVTFSPSGRYFVDSYSRVDAPPVTVLRNAEDGRAIRTLEEADITRLLEIGWPLPAPFTVLARDGVTILHGLMFKPSDFDPTRKYPVIDYIYPGPQRGSVGEWHFSLEYWRARVQALAELGFIVIKVDHMGTPYRGKDFHDAYYGKMGDNGIPDHIAALRQLANRHPFIDLDRVGIYGNSGGGFASTRAILEYPDVFHVAVSAAGNHDNRSYHYTWGEKYQGLMEVYEDGTDSFLNQVNAELAANLRGKLFLIHGDLDDNVHPAMTLQVAHVLIEADKTFDMLIMPERQHSMREPYVIRRTWDYFVTHLLGKEPPPDYVIAGPGN